MNCQKCGTKINDGDSFCTQCGTPVETVTPQENISNNQPEQPKDAFDENDKGNKLCILSLILKYGVLALSAGIIELLYNFTNIISEDIGDFVISTLFVIIGICSLAAFVLMVIVRIKYPKNLFGKILMWIYIVEIILAIIAIVILFLACMACVNSLDQFFSNCRGCY
jgi:hypothetical protein